MNWKIFQEPLIPIVIGQGVIIDLALVLLIIGLLTLTAILLTKAKPSIWLRWLTQLIALIIVGLMFSQCLHNEHNITLAIFCIWKGCASYFAHNLGGSSYYFAFAIKYLWFPSIIVLFVILFGRRLYCYWLCPVGFIQDITAKIEAYKRKHLSARASKIVNWLILIVLTVIIGLIGWLKWPSELILAMGAWYGFILIIVMFLMLFRIVKESRLRSLKYFVLGATVISVFIGYDNIEGPWCVVGRATLIYSPLLSFFTVIITSMIIPRAFCKYACPDGAFFQLLNRKKKIPEDN